MAARDREKSKGVLSLIGLAFVFASMGIFARELSVSFTVLQQTYLRIFTAFILALIIFNNDLDFRKIKQISRREWSILILRSITLYLIGVTLISQAFITTKYSNAAFIGGLPMTAILGFLFLKEKVTAEKIIYLILGFAGVVLIAVKDYSGLFSWGQGEIFALIASVSFAVSYIARKWQGDLLNNKEIATIIFLISSILLFITSVGIGEGTPSVKSFSGFIILVILISAIFNVANLFLTNYGFQKVEAVIAGNLLMLEVVFAMMFSIFLYRETLLAREIIGGLAIVVSAYQMNKLSKA